MTFHTKTYMQGREFTALGGRIIEHPTGRFVAWYDSMPEIEIPVGHSRTDVVIRALIELECYVLEGIEDLEEYLEG